MAEGVTLADVAKAAGVSKATASRALRDSDHPDVSAATREAVRRVAGELEYRPNATAQALRQGRFRTLSLVLPIVTTGYLGWWEPALIAAREEAAARGRRLAVHLLDARSEDFDGLLSELADAPPEAIVLVTPNLTLEQESQVQGLGIPAVFIDDKRRHDWTTTVCGDSREGGYLAGRHLVEQGRRRIAVVIPKMQALWLRERLAGFRSALDKAGVPLHRELIVESDEAYMPERPRSPGIETLLDRREPFDAVFAVTDSMAVSALRSLQRAGRGVPEEVAVAGFNDERAAWLVDPQLTTVRQPIADYGRTAARLALERVDGDADPRQVALPVELIVRESTVDG